MPELGSHGQAYKDAFSHWQEDVERQRTNPVASDTYNTSLRQSEIIMNMIEDEASADFAKALQGPESDPDVELSRTVLQKMLDDPSSRPSVITEDKIRDELNKLPQPEDHSDEDKLMARAFYVGRSLNYLFHGHPVVFRDEIAAEPQSSTQEDNEQGEVLREELEIKYYKKDKVLVFDDGSSQSIKRKINSAYTTAEQESAYEDLRLAAFRFLAEHPGEEFTSGQIWARISPDDAGLNSREWGHIHTFLADELVYKEQPIIDVSYGGKAGRIRHYSSVAFAPKIESIDEESGTEQLLMFELPNGELVAGVLGKAIKLMLAASSENPVSLKTLLEKGLYTQAEIDELKKPGSLLSRIVGHARDLFRKNGVEDQFSIFRVLLDEKNPGSNVRQSAYWMRRAGQESEPIGQDDPKPIKLNPEETEAKRAEAESLHRAHIVAMHIYNRRDLIAAKGLTPMPEEALGSIKAVDEISLEITEDPDARHEHRRVAYKELSDALHDDNVDDFLDQLEHGDPRDGLINYVFDMLRSENREVFKSCLEARVANTDGRRASDGQLKGATWIEYTFPGEENVIRINRGDNSPMTVDALESMDQTSPDNISTITDPEPEKGASETIAPEALHKAALLARGIAQHADRLVALGLKPLPEEALTALISADELYEPNDDPDEMIPPREYSATYDGLLQLIKKPEELFNKLRADDPRRGLIEYVEEMTKIENFSLFDSTLLEADQLDEEISAAAEDLSLLDEASSPTPLEPVVIENDEEEAEQGAVITDISGGNGRNGNGEQRRLTNKERKEQMRQSIQKEATRPIRSILRDLLVHGLANGQAATFSQIRGVFPGLQQEVFEQHLGKNGRRAASTKVNLHDIIFVQLAENGSDLIQRAARTGTHKRALRDLIDQEVSRFKSAQARKRAAQTS